MCSSQNQCQVINKYVSSKIENKKRKKPTRKNSEIEHENHQNRSTHNNTYKSQKLIMCQKNGHKKVACTCPSTW